MESWQKKVKNLVICTSFKTYTRHSSTIVNELVTVFTSIEVLVLADQLYNTCHEDSEEFVWLRGQLVDEIRSLAQPEVDAQSRERWRELEIEKEHRHLLTGLLLWRGSVQYSTLNDEKVDNLLQVWASATTREMPTIIIKSITTTRTKDRLLSICGSDVNFQALIGLDWGLLRDSISIVDF